MFRHAAPILIALVAPLSALAGAVPLEIPTQGRLLDASGSPLQGDHDLTVSLHDAATGGTQQWSDTLGVTFDNGYYTAVLGSSAALDAALFDGSGLWLGLAVDGAAALPQRHPLLSVPFAIHADTAWSVQGGVVDASEIRVNGTTVIDSSGAITGAIDTLGALSCASGEIARFDGGAWACAGASAHDHQAADIATGTLDVARLPVGTSSDTVAAGDHGHSLSTLAGELSADQLPSGPVDLAAGSTLDGAPFIDEADAVAAVEAAPTVTLSGQLSVAGGIADRTWKLVAQNTFANNTSEGWSPGILTACAGWKMIHGYNQVPQNDETKTFSSLPPHTELKIEFVYHFIDSWDAEKGFLEVDDTEAWAVVARHTNNSHVCGNAGWGDYMGVESRVEMAHTASTVKLAFGSTLDSGGTDESYGVSNIRVWVR